MSIEDMQEVQKLTNKEILIRRAQTFLKSKGWKFRDGRLPDEITIIRSLLLQLLNQEPKTAILEEKAEEPAGVVRCLFGDFEMTIPTQETKRGE